eukprot:12421627-Karenia_brevis.AAC.1
MTVIHLMFRSWQATPLTSLAPAFEREMLTNPDQYILRDARALELANEHDGQVTPYWDPKPRFSRLERLRLFERLRVLKLVGFRQAIRGRVGRFFVSKKDGTLRMIIDGRESSRLCRKPPHS